MKSCVIYPTKKQQNFRSLSNCRYCADRAQSLSGPALNIWHMMFQISFGAVIPKRLKAVLLAYRVFLISTRRPPANNDSNLRRLVKWIYVKVGSTTLVHTDNQPDRSTTLVDN